MELKVRNGDYIPDGEGGLLRAEGEEELLQRVMWKLTVQRGSFPFLPELGSRLHLLMREKPSARESLALQYAAQALEDEADLTVNDASLSEDGTLRVTVQRQEQTVEVTVYL